MRAKRGSGSGRLRRSPGSGRGPCARWLNIAAGHNDPSALVYYEALGRTGAATAEDWRDLARLAFRFGRVAQARLALEELRKLPAAAQLPSTQALQAEALGWEGRWPEALSLARAAMNAAAAAGSDSGEERLLTARLLLRAPGASTADQSAQRREGLALLGALAAQPDAIGLRALQALQKLTESAETAPLLAGADVKPWMEAAARNPGATAETRIKCWDLQLAATPARRAALAEELATLSPRVSKADQLEIARWLAHHAELARARELAAPCRLESEDWFMVYLDAAAGLGDWELVLKEVTAPEAGPLPSAVRRLFQLRAELILERQPNVGFAWSAITIALESATPKQQLYVATYAEQMGFATQAAPIYLRLLRENDFPQRSGDQVSPQRLACYLGAIRTGATAMETASLAKFFGEFASEFPDLSEVQNDAAYLNLLIGNNAAAAGETARGLLRQDPSLLAYRTTVALADLRQGRPREALAWYAGLDIDWASAPERYRAVWAAVLAANQREEEAAKLRATLHSAALRMEERELAGIL